MALNSILRRASSSVLPLALRSVAAPRSFHHAIPAAITIGKHNFSKQLNPGFLLPFLRSYSAAPTDANLLQVIEYEIKCAEEDKQDSLVEIPEDFPFEIQDNPGERTITLIRKFDDETIKVEVDMPDVAHDYGEEDNNEESDNNEAGENDEQDQYELSSLPVSVSITKDGVVFLDFSITARPDEITIDNLTIRKADSPEDLLGYEGPVFNDLDVNLQKAFHKYLDTRGINSSTTKFLHEYMVSKDTGEYLMWLKDVKSFIEK